MNPKVLIIGNPLAAVEAVVDFRKKTAETYSDAEIIYEQYDRLLNCTKNTNIVTFEKNTFDVVYHGYIPPISTNLTEEYLSFLSACMKPGSILYSKEKSQSVDDLKSLLICSGFVNIKIESDGECKYQASLPEYEIGTKVSLPLAKRNTQIAKKSAQEIWKMTSDEIMQDDDLLDEEDMKKPVKSTVDACGPTAKKKACKNCTCGLAEAQQVTIDTTVSNFKSSCGSCYLGDAFRCSSCPYMGMPAFKPGEKIELKIEDDL